MIRRMIDTDPPDETQLAADAQRLAGDLGISAELARAIILRAYWYTWRDEEGRLMADAQDIADALIDGDIIREYEE